MELGVGCLRSQDPVTLGVVRICDHLCDHGHVVCSCDRLIPTLQFFQTQCLVLILCVSAFLNGPCYNIET